MRLRHVRDWLILREQDRWAHCWGAAKQDTNLPEKWEQVILKNQTLEDGLHYCPSFPIMSDPGLEDAECGPRPSGICITWRAVRNANKKLWVQNPLASVLGCLISPRDSWATPSDDGSEDLSQTRELGFNKFLSRTAAASVETTCGELLKTSSQSTISASKGPTLYLKRAFLPWRMEFHLDIMCIMVFGVGFLKK